MKRISIVNGFLFVWAIAKHKNGEQLGTIEHIDNTSLFKCGVSLGQNGNLFLQSECCAELIDDIQGNINNGLILDFFDVSVYVKDTMFSFHMKEAVSSCIYYAKFDGQIFVASDIRYLLKIHRDKLSLNPLSAAHFLHLGAPLSNETLTNEIKRVGFSQNLCLNLKNNKVHLEPSKNISPIHISSGNHTDKLGQELLMAIENESSLHKKGILLSGGIDSAILAALSSTSSNPVEQAFTLKFDEKYEINEDQDAAKTARYFGIKHHSVELTVDEALEYLETLLSEATPIASWTAIGHRKLLDYSESLGVSRLLSGLGSDELFFGYTPMAKYFFSATEKTLHTDTNKWLDLYDDVDKLEPYKGMARFFEQHDLNKEYIDAINYMHIKKARLFSENCEKKCDLSTFIVGHELYNRLPDTLMPSFNYNDSSCVVQYPFLAKRVFNFALSLGWQHRVSYNKNKWWHKHLVYNLAKKILPAEVWKRKKGIYTIPYGHWLSDRKFGTYVLDKCTSRKDVLNTILNDKVVNKLLVELEKVAKGKQMPTLELTRMSWTTMVFSSWIDNYCK